MRAALLAVAACGHGAASMTTKDPVAIAQLPVGCEVGVVELDGARFVFNRDSVSVLRGGVIAGTAGAPGARWDAALGITAPDGGRWAVGLAGGSLWRVTTAGGFEAVGARLGIGDARVLSIAGAGDAFAAGLVGGVAFSRDGLHVTRFSGGDAGLVAVASHRIAVGGASSVEIFDLVKGARTSYAVDDIASMAFIDAASDEPRLALRAGGVAYVEDAGALRRIPAPSKLRQLVVSGARVWMLGDAGLFLLEGPALVRASTEVTSDSLLFSATAGDVWLAHAGVAPRLVRYALDVRSDGSGWQATVAPVFQHTCSKCHLPGGEAELDLSTPAAWLEQAAALRQVLHTRTMPPAGVEISETDRDALQRWLGP